MLRTQAYPPIPCSNAILLNLGNANAPQLVHLFVANVRNLPGVPPSDHPAHADRAADRAEARAAADPAGARAQARRTFYERSLEN